MKNSTTIGDATWREHRPLLLLVGSGGQPYREYILRSVARRYRLWLLQPGPVTWQGQYLVGSTMVDTADVDLIVEAARDLATRMEVDGVLCYDEALILPAGHVRDALGLTGMTAEVAGRCRDKRATREALDRAGVPPTKSVCVGTLEGAQAAARAIGYPVVLKPRGLAGSLGVVRADSDVELAECYDVARSASHPGVPVYDDGVLVEEYLDGPEISVDSVVFEGVCTPLVLAHKQVAYDPYFEEVGHVVAADDPLLRDAELLRFLTDCHRALGIRNGVTHSELRLTPRGPRLIEVNARLGGDLIPYLGSLATGVDAAMAAADVEVGRLPTVSHAWSRAAAIRFLYPEQDCTVTSVVVHRDLAPPAVYQAGAAAQEGETLRLPPRGYIGRYGFVITVGDTPDECLRALEGADDVVSLQGEPLEAAGAVA